MHLEEGNSGRQCVEAASSKAAGKGGASGTRGWNGELERSVGLLHNLKLIL